MPQTPEQLALDYKWGLVELSGTRIDAIKKFREYYDGIQPLAYASEKMTSKYGNLFTKYSYNRSSSVVDSLADRLHLTGFKVTTINNKAVQDGDAQAEAIQDKLDLMFKENRMDARQGEQITESLKCGISYAIVWPRRTSEGETVPTFYLQNSDECVIRHDRELQVKLMAMKIWQESSKKWRVNLYYPDFIWKFTTEEPSDDRPESLEKLIPWVADPDMVAMGFLAAEINPLPNPYGEVPVFAFVNNGPLDSYGRSELRDVMPLQDALNKACTDMLVAMEYAAYRQRYATGLSLGMPDAITGKIVSPFKPGAGEVWTGPAGATFGDFQETDLNQFLAVQADYDKKIANVTRIPAHWLDMTGTPPSGESRKAAEGPLVKKLTDRQLTLGDSYEDASVFALKTMGSPGIRLEAIWESAELRSDKDTAEVSIIKKQFGVSDKQLQRENGYTENQIETMESENQDKVEQAQAAFNAGATGTLPSGGGNASPDSPGITNLRDAARTRRQGNGADSASGAQASRPNAGAVGG